MRHALALACVACLEALAGRALAGAVTDGSVGPVQSLSGAFTVPQALGTVRGANLFHSFARFGIAPGESATFSTTDAGLRHVIARVTGGEASLLQGPLLLQAAAGSRPDFVLVNPSGITVAAGASFDVPAGLHLSTAHEIRFADGGRWDTRSATASSLSVAAPESFGFLGPAAPLRWSDAALTLQPGARLQLSGGDVTVERSRLLVQGGGAELQAQGRLALLDGAELSVVNDSDQPAPGLRVRAGTLLLDGAGQATGLSSYALGAGAGGALQLDVAGEALLVDGGQIFSATFGAGAGGDLSLRAASLTMEARGSFAFIGTQSLQRASGDTGTLRVDLSGAARLSGASVVTTQAVAEGAAAPLQLNAASLSVDGLGLGYISGIDGRGGGAVQVRIGGDLLLTGGGAIGSRSHELHAPQPVDVSAARILLEGGSGDTGQISSFGSAVLRSAEVRVQAGEWLRLGPGGQINSATLGNGGSGDVNVRAPLLTIDAEGGARNTGVFSSAYGSERGDSGTVTLQAGTLQVLAGGVVASESIAAQGNAGRIVLQADRVLVSSNGSERTANVRSIAWGAAGNAGRIQVDAAQQLEVADGGAIVAGALGVGSAGEIVVRTPQLLIDGRGNGVYFTGIAGDILTNQGAGAAVRIDAGRVELRDGGSISTSTFTSADAGSVRLNVDTLHIDGRGTGGATGISATSSGAGRAGDVQVSAREITLTDDALVTTAALDSGAGGRIGIDATRLTMDRSAIIASATGGSGAAGDVTMRITDTLQMGGGTAISATTAGAGAGGRVDIGAGNLRASGVDERNGFGAVIVSRARAGSSGRSGSLTIDVRDTLELGPSASLSIANAAVVADPSTRVPGTLSVRAGQVRMQRSEISAAASGNVDAGSVRIDSAGALRLDQAEVRTSAQDGNGGAIVITAGGAVRLRDARISTSVEGERNGNGGDITVRAPALVLQTGFVQANTRAPRSRGGDVRVDVGVLLPDGGQAFVGGDRIVEFRDGVPGLNVVQAAAPDGVSGQLAVTLPQLDLSGHLAALFVVPIDFGPLGTDLCRVGEGSSFTRQGRGALPQRASDPLGPALR